MDTSSLEFQRIMTF